MTDDPLDNRQAERDIMVAEQIAARGITNPRLLQAMRTIPRHRFIPPATDAWNRAYMDGAQTIGEGQTISQPYIVALMSDALQLTGTERVLEIGAGSGYQTAILSQLAAEVVAIERIPMLAERAQKVLNELGVTNVRLLVGDGSQGWMPLAPYDCILAAAVAPQVPPALKNQLTPGGRLVLPVGEEGKRQELLLLKRTETGEFITESLGDVAFVPMIGASGFGLPDDLGAVE